MNHALCAAFALPGHRNYVWFLPQIAAMLWHLVEVAHLEAEDALVPSVLAWIREHFHEPCIGMPGDPDAVWQRLLELALQGQVRALTHSLLPSYAVDVIATRFASIHACHVESPLHALVP